MLLLLLTFGKLFSDCHQIWTHFKIKDRKIIKAAGFIPDVSFSNILGPREQILVLVTGNCFSVHLVVLVR